MKSGPILQSKLIAIGGSEDKRDDLFVLKRVVQEIQKKNFKVVIITTASKEPCEIGEDYYVAFKKLGATRIDILNIQKKAEANCKKNLKKLKNVDLIFFTGGDQLKLTETIEGTDLLDSIYNHFKSGVLIVGTSAGAVSFSEVMICGGKSREGLFKDKVFTSIGFNFVQNIIFDTHFMARGRMGRLMQTIIINSNCIGVGIGENSGIILSEDGTSEVIGTGQVILVDGHDIKSSNITNIETGESISFENIRVHSMINGDGYDFKKRIFLKKQEKRRTND